MRGIRIREGAPKKAHFSEKDLSRKILVGGHAVVISEVAAEDFDQYIYDILGKMYNKPGHLQNRYDSSFDYDWSYHYYRVMALNELHALNLLRVKATPSKPAVPLFAEEEPAC